MARDNAVSEVVRVGEGHGHRIEAYIDIPEQDITDGYGFPTGRKVAKFRGCNRRGYYGMKDVDEALAKAVLDALEEWAEPLRNAEKFNLTVQPKNGPPRWEISVDRSY